MPSELRKLTPRSFVRRSGTGSSTTAPTARTLDAWVGASIWIADFSLYERLLERKDEIDELLGRDGGEVVWNDANEKS